MKRMLAAGGAAAAIALLAACGSSQTPVQQAPLLSNSPVESGPQIGPGDTPVQQTTRIGQAFVMSYEQNGVPTTWRVTLDSVTSGGPGIFDRSILEASAASTGEAYVTPTPSTGKKFVLVKFTVTNESHSNQPWGTDSVTVNVGMNAYETDSNGPGYDVSSAYMQEAEPPAADFGLQPGDSGPAYGVYEVPANATVTSVSVPLASNEGQVLILARL